MIAWMSVRLQSHGYTNADTVAREIYDAATFMKLAPQVLLELKFKMERRLP